MNQIPAADLPPPTRRKELIDASLEALDQVIRQGRNEAARVAAVKVLHSLLGGGSTARKRTVKVRFTTGGATPPVTDAPAAPGGAP